jgi:glycosyltransferase involved in cell wall biosynthesis
VLRWFKSPIPLIVIVLVCSATALGALLFWNAVETRALIELARKSSGEVPVEELDKAKTREEIIGKKYENEARGLVVNYLLSNFASAVTLLGALCGGLIALYGYMDARRKEALDRAASDLKDTLSHLASKESQERVVGVVGLQHFLVPDRNEFHRAALTALVAAARTEQDEEVLHSIRIAIEQAMRVVAKDVLTQVSWQKVHADRVDLAGLRLEGVDFRDASLQDAQLNGCRLGSCNFTNARLQGARLDGADLSAADLTYADLAGASLVAANVSGAKFSHAKVKNLDLARARLGKLEVDIDTIPWEQIRNWRTAVFDSELREKLIGRYGPPPHGPRVLMLMWEIPPFVAGGTWTACYHFARNLLRRGADLTVVVPWKEAAILSAPFGSEVKIVPLGIELPDESSMMASLAGARGGMSPYASSWSPYGAPAWRTDAAWSPYSSFGSAQSPYASPQGWSPYGGLRGSFDPYGASADFARPRGRRARSSLEGSALLRLIEEFRERVQQHIVRESPDLIHAHDWVTFEAARECAADRKIPWVAHVHSVEIERRPEGPDLLVERMERAALEQAAQIVVPSRITGDRIIERYAIPGERIHVVPNVLSPDRIGARDTGRIETQRVIFLGRLSHQKGVDRFVKLAAELHETNPDAAFEVYGGGQYPIPYGIDYLTFHGPLTWERRADAFRDATVIVVPSREEPFGMVILEAMQHRVPVVYPKRAGAAEVLATGAKVDTADIAAMADAVHRLLNDHVHWENVVEAQLAEIRGYPARGFEQALIDLWARLAPVASHTAAALH